MSPQPRKPQEKDTAAQPAPEGAPEGATATAAPPAPDPVAQQMRAMEERLEKIAQDAEAAQQRAADAEKRAAEERAAFEARLEQERAAREEAEAQLEEVGGDESAIERLAAVLLEAQGGSGKKSTFGAHETADDVMQSLEGTLSDVHPDDTLLDEPVVFRSKGAYFSAVRKGRQRWQSPTGEAQTTSGIKLDFSPNGEFSTRSVENIRFLRGRPSFNVEFWELGSEPGRAPDSELAMDRIIEAVSELDDAKLEAIQREEEQGPFKRQDVIKAAKAGRRRIQAISAAAQGE